MKYFFSLLIFSAFISCASPRQHCAKAIVQIVLKESDADALNDDRQFAEFEERITSDAFIFATLQKCGISDPFSKVSAYRDSIYCERTNDQSNLLTVFVWQANPERAVMFIDTLLDLATHIARIDYEHSFGLRVDSINSALNNAVARMEHEKAQRDSLKAESKINHTGKDSIVYQQAMTAFAIAEKEYSVCLERKLFVGLELTKPAHDFFVMDKPVYVGQTEMRK